MQHEQPVEYFGGKEKFKIQQEHDRRKRDYAKEHNIELLEIWYWDFNNIEQILSEKIFSKASEIVESKNQISCYGGQKWLKKEIMKKSDWIKK